MTPTIAQSLQQQVLIRSRLLGADLATGAAAASAVAGDVQGLVHIVQHPNGVTSSAFVSRKPTQNYAAGNNHLSVLQPASGPQVSRA